MNLELATTGTWLARVLWVLDNVVVAYVALFFLVNFALLALAHGRVRRDLKAEHVRPAATGRGDRFLPTVTLLVPAYNEEVTIAESIRSLLRLDYPAYEIVICNDGSKDRTVEVLVREFDLVRVDLEDSGRLATARVRGFYERRGGLPPGVRRLLLIDKDNGGKADALNAAINLAQGDFVTSMDADSLLEPDALLRAVQPVALDPEGIVAIGAQVGLSNGSVVAGGRVEKLLLPRSWIARFQVVEYMRSFVQGRTALSALNSVLILSGVFALMRRDLVLAVGGYLTKHMRSRLGIQYCSEGAHTVCEDMEVVVRLHRYLLDKGLPGRVVSLPFPVAWTEAPENYRDLGKQRARWYRGLLEVLSYHRAMMLRPRFAQVGLFSLPYQLFFEALAPVLESVGYVLLVLTLALGALSPAALVVFLAFATALNLALSSLSVVLAIYSERGSTVRAKGVSLFPYAHLRDVLTLVFAGFLSNFGYRQYLVLWQLRGLWDFLKGKKGWDKFARRGFATAAPA